MKLFVVAISQKEADEIASQIGHSTREEAELHLRDVQSWPTDPYYAAQYKIYEVETDALDKIARGK